VEVVLADPQRQTAPKRKEGMEEPGYHPVQWGFRGMTCTDVLSGGMRSMGT